MGFLTKDQILSSDDLPFRDVEVPEWGGTVRVRTMTGTERDSFESSIYDATGPEIKFDRTDFRAKLLARTIVNEKDERLFTDKEVGILGKKSAKALIRAFDVAQELNGISKEEQDDIKKK